MRQPTIPSHPRGLPLAAIEVKNRQSREWRRYEAKDLPHIKWDAVDAARALYRKVGGWSRKTVIYHYDIMRLGK